MKLCPCNIFFFISDKSHIFSLFLIHTEFRASNTELKITFIFTELFFAETFHNNLSLSVCIPLQYTSPGVFWAMTELLCDFQDFFFIKLAHDLWSWSPSSSSSSYIVFGFSGFNRLILALFSSSVISAGLIGCLINFNGFSYLMKKDEPSGWTSLTLYLREYTFFGIRLIVALQILEEKKSNHCFY